jgi:hypothetical protein
MRTSADSIREQAARFFAMAEMARAEGNLGLAELLTEAGRRATADIVEQQAQREDQLAATCTEIDSGLPLKKQSPGCDVPGLRVGHSAWRYRAARRCRQFALYQATSLRFRACCSLLNDTPIYCRFNSSSCVQRGSAMDDVDVIERNNPAHKAPRQ